MKKRSEAYAPLLRIDHFTVVDIVTWPSNECEAEVDSVPDTQGHVAAARKRSRQWCTTNGVTNGGMV